MKMKDNIARMFLSYGDNKADEAQSLKSMSMEDFIVYMEQKNKENEDAKNRLNKPKR